MGDTVLYEAADAVATLTLNRPERRNAITAQLVDDFDAALARALADDEVRVVRLRGAGSAFCAGYDIGWGSESMREAEAGAPWDPVADYRTMRRFVDAYMALWRSPKPVEDCRIGYPPARVWGSPTTAMWMYRLGLERSKRLLLTGDAIDGARAVQWGLASEAVPAAELEAAGMALARRVALLPHNQAAAMNLLVNQAFEAMGLHTTQLIGTLLDGAARHTPEGTAFTQRALADVRGAVADRDAPFGDYGQGPATV